MTLTDTLDVLRRRRSIREYVPGQIPDADVDYILGCATQFAARCSFTSPQILALPQGPDFDRITAAAVGGLAYNQWLRSTPASHLLVCTTRAGTVSVRAVEEAAMCMHVAVLAAADRGYGTCWMTGIDHARTEQALPDPARVVAISPLGVAGPGGLQDATLHLMPRDRKPVDEVTMQEVWQ